MATVTMYNSFPLEFLQGRFDDPSEIWAHLLRSDSRVPTAGDTSDSGYISCSKLIPYAQLLYNARFERNGAKLTFYGGGIRFNQNQESFLSYMQSSYVVLHGVTSSGGVGGLICFIPAAWDLYNNDGTIVWPNSKIFDCDLVR